MTAPLDHRETSDRYHGELFRDGDYRVVVCRDGIQWLFQKRAGPEKYGAGARWVSIGYFTTRQALTRAWTGKTGRVNLGSRHLPRVLKRRAA